MDRKQMLIISGAAMAIVLAALAVWLLTRGDSETTATPMSTPSSTATLPSSGAIATEAGAPSGDVRPPDPLDASNQTAQPASGDPISTSAPANAPANTAADVYLDDRSGPVQLVSSFVNALNRKEYLRAYSYFENPDRLGPFATFARGYSNTLAVQLTTGAVTDDAGAGQLSYKVPVTFKVDITGGEQTFVGCYRLHMSQPSIQATPPFRPLAIQGISIEQVAATADTAALMSRACTSP